MYKILIFIVCIVFSEVSSANSKWVFYCPALQVFCSEVRNELKIDSPELNKKYSGIAFIEDRSWSSEINFEDNPVSILKVEDGFCKNTYIYILFHDATNTECKYIVNEL